MKNTFEQTEERLSKLVNRSTEITKPEKEKKTMEKNKESRRDPWGTIKCLNILRMTVSGEEEKGRIST